MCDNRSVGDMVWGSQTDAPKSGSGALLLMPAVGLGITLGVGLFTFGYARGASYLTNDPEACANCHVMREQHQSWMKSSHRKVAVCNDCHTPAGPASKYAVKAMNGFLHSWAFTTGRFPDRIRIRDFNRRVAERACVKCHGDIVSVMQAVRGQAGEVGCAACHPTVGHH